MPRVETVEFDGTAYHRYPDSPHRTARLYYKSGGRDPSYLHRDVWRAHHGAIPEGHHIHHVDGDPSNNGIENLELVTPAEHAERHPDLGGTQSEEHHAAMVEGAKAWHASDEGREWHRDHFDESLGTAYTPTEKECAECGETFEDRTSNDTKRFCTVDCRLASQLERGSDERVCPACLQIFHRPPSYSARTCSTACAGALVAWENRVG